MTASVSYEERYSLYASAVERELEKRLPADGSAVTDAMRYSLLGGGKRLRGVLAIATEEMLRGSIKHSYAASAALEMLHCYSLIHDDLPCMDDDSMRRGKPSCHIAFGEANAMLAGDGLLTEAFAVLGTIDDASVMAKCVRELAAAAGHEGMILGQELDLSVPESSRDKEGLDRINSLKTGRLIRAAVRMGYYSSGIDEPDTLSRLDAYSERVGRAFQIIDDILDTTATSQQLGKDAGSDGRNDKATYAGLLGTEKAFAEAERLTLEAVKELSFTGRDCGFLGDTALGMLRRNK